MCSGDAPELGGDDIGTRFDPCTVGGSESTGSGGRRRCIQLPRERHLYRAVLATCSCLATFSVKRRQLTNLQRNFPRSFEGWHGQKLVA